MIKAIKNDHTRVRDRVKAILQAIQDKDRKALAEQLKAYILIQLSCCRKAYGFSFPSSQRKTKKLNSVFFASQR